LRLLQLCEFFFTDKRQLVKLIQIEEGFLLCSSLKISKSTNLIDKNILRYAAPNVCVLAKLQKILHLQPSKLILKQKHRHQKT
jgi:hypothetical protein